jgi:hypothetical protein
MNKRFPLRPFTLLLGALVAIGAVQAALAAQASADSAVARVSRLSLEVDRADSVRAVKRLQETYAQYSQFGLWDEMAALFASNGQVSRGKDEAQGPAAIRKYFLDTFGEGVNGLKPGGLHTQMALRPLINVSADGQSAKGRWWEFSMTGQFGVKAEWAGGIYENDYVREGGKWKIARARYHPIFAGPYATGWRNVDEDQKIVPYHFTPDEAGIPVPDLQAASVIPVDAMLNPEQSLALLEKRIADMNDEDQVRNLQNAYGYYVDRKMWDDVTDLFTADGALSIANVGVYAGPRSIRRALERSGPAGIKHGQLNEHLQLNMAVTIEPGGMEARSRGLEFVLLGESDKGTASWGLAIFQNRYVKKGKTWQIREMRIFPFMKTEYSQGWAKSQIVDAAPAKEFAPDRAVLKSDVMTPGAIPAFFQANLVTGKAVALPAGAKVVGTERLLPAPAVGKRPAPTGTFDARIKDAQRRLLMSKAWDGAENLNSAYGDYLDDLDFGPLGRLFAKNGIKEVPFKGMYITRERIMARDATSAAPGSRPRTSIPIHWRTQPVILVAEDGRSASLRSRLFQGGSARTRGTGINGGMYTDQVVLEDGMWKLWSVNIDEFHWQSPSYEGGWSAAKDPAPRPAAAAGAPAAAARPAPVDNYPPDIANTDLGERERGFQGGPGQQISWPGILPMWFHYKNPVSGRTPEFYWPDCESCIVDPKTSMKNHGYLLPPN